MYRFMANLQQDREDSNCQHHRDRDHRRDHHHRLRRRRRRHDASDQPLHRRHHRQHRDALDQSPDRHHHDALDQSPDRHHRDALDQSPDRHHRRHDKHSSSSSSSPNPTPAQLYAKLKGKTAQSKEDVEKRMMRQMFLDTNTLSDDKELEQEFETALLARHPELCLTEAREIDSFRDERDTSALGPPVAIPAAAVGTYDVDENGSDEDTLRDTMLQRRDLANHTTQVRRRIEQQHNWDAVFRDSSPGQKSSFQSEMATVAAEESDEAEEEATQQLYRRPLGAAYKEHQMYLNSADHHGIPLKSLVAQRRQRQQRSSLPGREQQQQRLQERAFLRECLLSDRLGQPSRQSSSIKQHKLKPIELFDDDKVELNLPPSPIRNGVPALRRRVSEDVNLAQKTTAQTVLNKADDRAVLDGAAWNTERQVASYQARRQGCPRIRQRHHRQTKQQQQVVHETFYTTTTKENDRDGRLIDVPQPELGLGVRNPKKQRRAAAQRRTDQAYQTEQTFRNVDNALLMLPPPPPPRQADAVLRYRRQRQRADCHNRTAEEKESRQTYSTANRNDKSILDALALQTAAATKTAESRQQRQRQTSRQRTYCRDRTAEENESFQRYSAANRDDNSILDAVALQTAAETESMESRQRHQQSSRQRHARQQMQRDVAEEKEHVSQGPLDNRSLLDGLDLATAASSTSLRKRAALRQAVLRRRARQTAALQTELDGGGDHVAKLHCDTSMLDAAAFLSNRPQRQSSLDASHHHRRLRRKVLPKQAKALQKDAEAETLAALAPNSTAVHLTLPPPTATSRSLQKAASTHKRQMALRRSTAQESQVSHTARPEVLVLPESTSKLPIHIHRHAQRTKLDLTTEGEKDISAPGPAMIAWEEAKHTWNSDEEEEVLARMCSPLTWNARKRAQAMTNDDRVQQRAARLKEEALERDPRALLRSPYRVYEEHVAATDARGDTPARRYLEAKASRRKEKRLDLLMMRT